MPLIIFLGALILLLGFSMDFGWEWIKLLAIFLIAGIITSPLIWSVFIKKLLNKF